MTGPMIWIVRLSAAGFALLFIHLIILPNSPPPPDAVIILTVLFLVGVGFWARAERMRGGYLRSMPAQKVVVHHRGSGSRIAEIIGVLGAIAGILTFLKSCN